jgi:hypothetical protein
MRIRICILRIEGFVGYIHEVLLILQQVGGTRDRVAQDVVARDEKIGCRDDRG